MMPKQETKGGHRGMRNLIYLWMSRTPRHVIASAYSSCQMAGS